MIPTPAIQVPALDGALRVPQPKPGEGAQPSQSVPVEGSHFQLQLDERVRELRPGSAAPQPLGVTELAQRTAANEPRAVPVAPDQAKRVVVSPVQAQPQFVPFDPGLAPPPPSAVEGVGVARWQSVARNWREFLQWSDTSEAQIRARSLAHDHPLVSEFRDEQRRRLIGLQLELGAAQFQMELVSKVIEHGTGGARQVLQTQA
ncbi:MAG: hypothetical protein IT454_15185 [Planctomycetes bacterium]|nr:hypothetical protein [Planctomycetota bacterium]